MAVTVIKKLKSDIDVKPIYDELLHPTNQKFVTWGSSNFNADPSHSTKSHGHVWESTGIMMITNGATDQLNREKNNEDPTIWKYDYPELQKFFKWFTDTYGGIVRKANCYNTPPGKSVKSHTDSHDYFKNKDRFHLVLSGRYEYTVHKKTEVLSKGDLWWFNNKATHGSYNHGTEDKINVVFDVAGLR